MTSSHPDRRRAYWESLPEYQRRLLRQILAIDRELYRLSLVTLNTRNVRCVALRLERAKLELTAIRLDERNHVTFAELIAKEVARAGSQTALAGELGVRQSRISAWLTGTVLPSADRMRDLVTQLGYSWETVKVGLLDPGPPRVVTVAPRSLTVKIPADLQASFGLEDEVPERVRRLAWEAAAGAFQAVVRASGY